MVFTETDNPALICHREEEYKGDKYHFSSDQCMSMFDNEPERYIQALLPPFCHLQVHLIRARTVYIG